MDQYRGQQQRHVEAAGMEQLLHSIRDHQKQQSAVAGRRHDRDVYEERQVAWFEQKIRQLQSEAAASERRYGRKPEGIEFLLEMDSMKAVFDQKYREFSLAAAHADSINSRIDKQLLNNAGRDAQINQLRSKYQGHLMTGTSKQFMDQESALKRSMYLNARVDDVRSALVSTKHQEDRSYLRGPGQSAASLESHSSLFHGVLTSDSTATSVPASRSAMSGNPMRRPPFIGAAAPSNRNTVYVRRASEWPDGRSSRAAGLTNQSTVDVSKIPSRDEGPSLFVPQVPPLVLSAPSIVPSYGTALNSKSEYANRFVETVPDNRNSRAATRYMPPFSAAASSDPQRIPSSSSYGKGYAVVGDAASGLYTSSGTTSNNVSSSGIGRQPNHGAHTSVVPANQNVDMLRITSSRDQHGVQGQQNSLSGSEKVARGTHNVIGVSESQRSKNIAAEIYTVPSGNRQTNLQSTSNKYISSRPSPLTVLSEQTSNVTQYRPQFASKTEIASTYLKKPGGVGVPTAGNNPGPRNDVGRMVSPIKAFQRPSLPGPTALVRPMVTNRQQTNENASISGDKNKLINDQYNKNALSSSSLSSEMTNQRDVVDKPFDPNMQLSKLSSIRDAALGPRLNQAYSGGYTDKGFNSGSSVPSNTVQALRMGPGEGSENVYGIDHNGWERVVERLPSDIVDGVHVGQRNDSMRMQRVPRPVRRRTSGESADNSLQRPNPAQFRAASSSIHQLADLSIDEEPSDDYMQFVNNKPVTPSSIRADPIGYRYESVIMPSGPLVRAPIFRSEDIGLSESSVSHYNANNRLQSKFTNQEYTDSYTPSDIGQTRGQLSEKFSIGNDAYDMQDQTNRGQSMQYFRPVDGSRDFGDTMLPSDKPYSTANQTIDMQKTQGFVTAGYTKENHNQNSVISNFDSNKVRSDNLNFTSSAAPLDLTMKSPTSANKSRDNIESLRLSPVELATVAQEELTYSPVKSSSGSTVTSANGAILISTSFQTQPHSTLNSYGNSASALPLSAGSDLSKLDTFTSDSHRESTGLERNNETDMLSSGDMSDQTNSSGEGVDSVDRAVLVREGEPEYQSIYPTDIIKNPHVVGILKKKPKDDDGMERRSRRRVKFNPLALLLDASLEGDMALLAKAMAEVADPSAPNDEGITALHNAICAGHYNVVEFLVTHGCDVNAPDTDGWRPLHCAASCNNLSMARLLVENGACVFAATVSDEETAAEKCEEDEMGYEGCSKYLKGIEDGLGAANDGAVFAVYDYDALQNDELSIKRGDKLIVVRRGDDREADWWWARQLNSRTEGYIAKNLLAMYPLHST